MSKKRFVQLSIATSVAATCGVGAQADSMLEAAMKATLPAVGPAVDVQQIEDALRLNTMEPRLATVRLR